jgi:putative endonuclease
MRVVDAPKRFVYVLRSLSDRTRYYTGVTSNVKARLSSHNAGACVHSVRHRPWELDAIIAFRDQARALRFERYLKSGSGVAFTKRHFRDAGSEPA